jgi:hypothetical protein
VTTGGPQASADQRFAVFRVLVGYGLYSPESRLAWLTERLGHQVDTLMDLTETEAGQIIRREKGSTP